MSLELPFVFSACLATSTEVHLPPFYCPSFLSPNYPHMFHLSGWAFFQNSFSGSFLSKCCNSRDQNHVPILLCSHKRQIVGFPFVSLSTTQTKRSCALKQNSTAAFPPPPPPRPHKNNCLQTKNDRTHKNNCPQTKTTASFSHPPPTPPIKKSRKLPTSQGPLAGQRQTGDLGPGGRRLPRRLRHRAAAEPKPRTGAK